MHTRGPECSVGVRGGPGLDPQRPAHPTHRLDTPGADATGAPTRVVPTAEDRNRLGPFEEPEVIVASGSGGVSAASSSSAGAAAPAAAPATPRAKRSKMSQPPATLPAPVSSQSREAILEQVENLSDDSDIAPPDEQDAAAMAEMRRTRERKQKQDAGVTAGDGAKEDWKSFDVAKAIRSLCHRDRSVVMQALQRLHVRWYHASEGQMTPILKAQGVPVDALRLIKPVLAQCMVCRDWHKPGPHNVATTKLALEFNEEAQFDLLFYTSLMEPSRGQLSLLHLVDMCIRWDVCVVVPRKTEIALLSAITQHWVSIFGPMRVLTLDGETAMRTRTAADWADVHHIELNFKAPHQKAWVVERHNELVRDALHKTESQLIKEGITIPFEQVLAIVVFVKNAITVVGNATPYQALFGRQPTLLPPVEGGSSGQLDGSRVNPGTLSKHYARVRECACQNIIEASAKARLARAQTHRTRSAIEFKELQPEHLCDIWFDKSTKDMPGWRGPARILSINHDQGNVSVRFQGRTLDRIGTEVRPHVPFLVFESALFADRLDHFRLVQSTAEGLPVGHTAVYGLLLNPAGDGWVLTKSAQSSEGAKLLRSAMIVASSALHLQGCLAVRLCRGVSSTAALPGFNGVELWYWLPARLGGHPEHVPYSFTSERDDHLRPCDLKSIIKPHIGDRGGWQDYPVIQFWCASPEVAEEALVQNPNLEIPFLGGAGTPATGPPDMEWSGSPVRRPATAGPGDPSQRRPPQPPGGPFRNSKRTPDSEANPGRRKPRQPQGPRVQNPKRDHEPPEGTPRVGPQQPPAPPDQPLTGRSGSSRGTTGSSASLSQPNVPPSPTVVPQPGEETQDEWDTDDEDEVLLSWVEQLQQADPDEMDEVEEDEEEDIVTTMSFHVRDPQYPITPDASFKSFSPLQSRPSPATVAEIGLEGPLARSLEGIKHPLSEGESVVTYLSGDGGSIQKSVIVKEFDALSPSDLRDHQDKVQETKFKELSDLHGLGCYGRMPRRQANNIVDTKWVIRWKLVDGVRSIKSRITMRGFKDAAQSLETFAGTATRWSQRVINSVAATEDNHTLFSLDVSKAFAKGMTFEELSRLSGQPLRTVQFELAAADIPLLKRIPGFEDFDPNREVLTMFKPIYGLKDAPRAWSKKLHEVLVKFGLRKSLADDQIYLWHHPVDPKVRPEPGLPPRRRIRMALSTHVDDLKGSATRKDAESLLAHLQKEVGTCSQEWQQMTHTGIEHVQSDKGVYAHQTKYAQQLMPMDISSIKGQPDETDAPGDFPSRYMSLLGGLAWLVLTRVDLAVYVQALQRRAHSPRVVDCKRINTVVRYAKRKAIGIMYGKLTGPQCITVFSDAAFKAQPEESSGLALRGCTVLLAEAAPEQLMATGGRCHLLEYVCRRQRRVVRSTYSAELNGLIDSIEIAILVQFLLHQVWYGCDQGSDALAKSQEDGGLRPLIKAATDAKAVFDSVAAPDICDPAECSLKLHLIALRNKIAYGIVDSLWWSDTRDMLADGLTKGSVNRMALQMVAEYGKHPLTQAVIRYTANTLPPLSNSGRTSGPTDIGTEELE